MDRLQAELQRLYLPPGATRDASGPPGFDPAGIAGQVKGMVLELAAPAGWRELSAAWQGIQADLGLPAPAIAVSGGDAYQLWFSLTEPAPAAQARAFLEGVRARYLAGVAPEGIRIQQAGVLPPAQVAPERWSAFVAPDLAPLFAEERWLDHPPGTDAQADLLSRVEGTPAEAFRRARAQLGVGDASHAPAAEPGAPGPHATGTADPRAFLLSVMQDPAVDLRLRIEAAKALLPFTQGGD